MTTTTLENTATRTLALSKDDIKALRSASSVHARRYGDGLSRLELYRRANRTEDIFRSRDEGYREIETRDDFINFQASYSRSKSDATAFAYEIGHGAYDEEWSTIASLLREGDEIECYWMAGNQCGYLDAAHGSYGDNNEFSFRGLCRDQLKLRVYRKGTLKYAFRVAESVCPDNSSRMIQGL